MWIMLVLGSCCLLRDRAGKLGESGEYWMGWSESGPHDIWSSEGGSPHLCPLQQALSCVPTHTGTNPPRNLVARRLPSWTIPYRALRMIEGIVLGLPTDYPVRFSHGR
jgi:hypothetical protein